SGADRHETNANVIKTFYPDKELSAMLVAKSDIIVDSITAGPLAAKLKSSNTYNSKDLCFCIP
ncbi:hypothetical protein BM533_21390, partial [Clostridioides difficile]